MFRRVSYHQSGHCLFRTHHTCSQQSCLTTKKKSGISRIINQPGPAAAATTGSSHGSRHRQPDPLEIEIPTTGGFSVISVQHTILLCPEGANAGCATPRHKHCTFEAHVFMYEHMCGRRILVGILGGGFGGWRMSPCDIFGSSAILRPGVLLVQLFNSPSTGATV